MRFSFARKVARRKGFEPLTPRFEVWCSIQLSYRRRFAFSNTTARLCTTLAKNRETWCLAGMLDYSGGFSG